MTGGAQEAASAPYVDPTDLTDFDAVFNAHYRRLVVSLRLSGADLALAEDIAQDAFVIAYGRWPRVRRGSSPAGYIYRVAFRLLKRRGTRHPQSDIRDLPAPDDIGAVETAIVVQNTLDRMPERRKRVAILCLQAGLSVQEASRILRIKKSTVRVHVHHARKSLSSALAISD